MIRSPAKPNTAGAHRGAPASRRASPAAIAATMSAMLPIADRAPEIANERSSRELLNQVGAHPSVGFGESAHLIDEDSVRDPLQGLPGAVEDKRKRRDPADTGRGGFEVAQEQEDRHGQQGDEDHRSDVDDQHPRPVAVQVGVICLPLPAGVKERRVVQAIEHAGTKAISLRVRRLSPTGPTPLVAGFAQPTLHGVACTKSKPQVSKKIADGPLSRRFQGRVPERDLDRLTTFFVFHPDPDPDPPRDHHRVQHQLRRRRPRRGDVRRGRDRTALPAGPVDAAVPGALPALVVRLEPGIAALLQPGWGLPRTHGRPLSVHRGGPSVRLDFAYPDAQRELHRGMPLVKWFLAIPHYLVLLFFNSAPWSQSSSPGLPSLLPAATREVLRVVEGVLRWNNRVIAYAGTLVTDRYPPFRLSA